MLLLFSIKTNMFSCNKCLLKDYSGYTVIVIDDFYIFYTDTTTLLNVFLFKIFNHAH